MLRSLSLVIALAVASPSILAQSMRCERVDAPAEIRAESQAELLPDIVLRCSATAAATQSLQVIVNSNTAFANRDVAPIASLNWAWNDAILLVGDPMPARQVACAPADGQTTCSAQSNANLFQGKKLEETTLVFQGVLAAFADSSRPLTLRITNLRVNAAAVAASKTPAPVITSVQIFTAGGGLIPVTGSERVSATPRNAMKFSLRNRDGLPVAAPAPALQLTPRSLPLGDPSSKAIAQVTFSEQVPNGFRRRNAGVTADDPKFLAAQSIPGAAYNTETGFYNPALPKTTRLNEAGLADAGTRLMVRFEGIPENTALWVSVRDQSTQTAPRAMLIYTDSKGAGSFNPMSPWVPGWAQLYSDNGKATAVWEVVSADPEQLEDFTFAVTLTALNGNPAFGIVKASAMLGPGDAAALPAFRSALPADTALPLIELATSIELPRLSIVSSASFDSVALAPDALMTAISSTIKAAGAVPEPGETAGSLQGVAVDIIDSLGRKFRARALAVAPGQFSFLTPANARTGPAVINLIVDDAVTASESVLIDPVAPALFTVTGDGLGYPVGEAIRLGSSDAPAPLASFDEASRTWQPNPIALAAGDKVYVTVLATGARNRSALGAVSALVGNKTVPAILANPHPDLPGVDSITVGPLPVELAGAGRTKFVIIVDGRQTQDLSIVLK